MTVVSAPALVALIGNVLATVAILPHLVQAIRERRPSGSPSGWALGGINAGLWLTYGLMMHTPEIGAPGWVTCPVSAVLGVWSWRHQRAGRHEVAALVEDGDEVDIVLPDVALDGRELAVA